jgi:peptidoglycan biosynthesis protein MviN/MurJ (putative lipid II flippase)
LGWTLLPVLAQGGIALSNSLGAGLQVAILLLVARRRLAGIEGQALGKSLARTAAAAALMGAAVLGFRALLPGAQSLVTGAGGLAVGTTTYVLAALLLGSQEIRELPGLLLKRKRRERLTPPST